jgi:hypothetical protein
MAGQADVAQLLTQASNYEYTGNSFFTPPTVKQAPPS